MNAYKKLLYSIVIIFLAVPVITEAVEVPNSFRAGTPAIADDVNENFNVLEGGVNTNETAITDHINDGVAHHLRYSDGEAQAAMGVKSNTNALNHDRYTDNEAVTAVSNANAFQPGYRRTVVVSPVGTEAQNGAALLAALAGITDASATNPYLIKIEPGVYDIGASSIVMKSHVDIMGSGSNVTRITSNQLPYLDAVVVLTDFAVLKDVFIENLSSFGAVGVDAMNLVDAQMENVKISIITGASLFGVYVIGSTIYINNVSVRGSTSSPTYGCVGMQVYGHSNVRLSNSTVLCDGGGNSWGVYFYDSDAELKNVESEGINGATSNIGLRTTSSDVGPYTVKVYNSVLSGVSNSIQASGYFNVYVGGSQLKGGNTFVGAGSLSCVGSYDENFTNPGGYSTCP